MLKLQRLNEIKYVKEEKDKAKLIAKGFKEIKETEKKEASNNEEKEVKLEEMTAEELKEYAKANGIDLGKAKLKEDIIATIKGSK